MNLDNLPMVALRAGVDRLVATFGAPKDLVPDTFMHELQRALRGWRVSEYDAAIGGAIAEERFFPRIAVIRKHRPPQMSGDGRPDVGVGNVCPSCHAHDYYAGYQTGGGAVVPRLRCECPQGGEGWTTDAALAWQETDKAFIGTAFHRNEHRRAA